MQFVLGMQHEPSLEPRTTRDVDDVWDASDEAATDQVDARRDVLVADPRATDPFLFLSEDWFSSVGFEWHPHRGFETVTYVVEGELEHRDNTGGHGVLGPGDLQWVTTGSGVLHTELAHEKKPVHTLQLWLNLPSHLKMSTPRYQNLRGNQVPTIIEPGLVVRVFSGLVHGVHGPADMLWPTTVIDTHLGAQARFVHDIPGDHTAFLYVLRGEIAVGPMKTRISEGQVAWFAAGTSSDPTEIEMFAHDDTHLLAYSSSPIREPIAQWGPFVMNTREEIAEAVEAYRRGDFGPLPH